MSHFKLRAAYNHFNELKNDYVPCPSPPPFSFFALSADPIPCVVPSRFSFLFSFSSAYFSGPQLLKIPEYRFFACSLGFSLCNVLSLMETLQIIPSRNLGPKLTENTVFNSFSGVRQVGFASLLSEKRKAHQSCCVKTRSYTEDRNGGGFISRRSNSAQDQEQEEGLLLGTEKDSSGSVVGFHLIPQSGKK